ncbi:MAG: RluA family pseudouridine synthase [Solobacterium sp.]|nr:RluA family pseudouridine synthase [Solobacterium sp.]
MSGNQEKKNDQIIHTVTGSENGTTVKALLKQMNIPRRTVTRLMQNRGILLNGVSVPLSGTVHTGDTLCLSFVQSDLKTALFLKEAPDILYEDEDLVIVNKPFGMPCHPSREHQDDMGTLLGLYYGNGFTVRTVGRLDKDVSGVMVYAKNSMTASQLSDHQIHKQYTAVITGQFEGPSGRLECRLKKTPYQRQAFVSADGKDCITDYETMDIYPGHSFVSVSIVTGRTHQIRATMAHFGHPLLGDKLYGGSTELIRRPALHCRSVTFIHPKTKKKITVVCDLPEDMQKLKSLPDQG